MQHGLLWTTRVLGLQYQIVWSRLCDGKPLFLALNNHLFPIIIFSLLPHVRHAWLLHCSSTIFYHDCLRLLYRTVIYLLTQHSCLNDVPYSGQVLTLRSVFKWLALNTSPTVSYGHDYAPQALLLLEIDRRPFIYQKFLPKNFYQKIFTYYLNICTKH